MSSINYIKVCQFLPRMSDIEKSSLLADLIGADCYGTASLCMKFLKADDFVGFKNHVIEMNETGQRLKENINALSKIAP